MVESMTFQNPTMPLMQEAKLHYGDGDFQVIHQGHYVRCAVTDKQILLSDLRYWSAEWQEAYAGADIALKRVLEKRCASSPAANS
jgi:hypothetical protein